MHFLLFVFVLTLATTKGQDDICATCNCTRSDDAQILEMNCANKSLQHVWGDWPPHNATIIVTYAGNNIVTLEPLPQTDAVIEIVLSRCQIKYLRSELFGMTLNVKYVDLSHNLLPAEEVVADKFKGPFNDSSYRPIALEHLNLAYNQIHSLGNKLFEHMPNLKILNLEGNDFTVIDIHTQLAISSIRQLQSLNLANNELTEMIVTAIESHENLTELNLSRNLLDFVPYTLSHIGKSLEILNLDDNPIIEFVSETFLGLENVIELSVNNLTKLKYVNANTFAAMPKLKKLSLSNNLRLQDIDREAFGINQTLEEFYLKNNNLFRIDHKLLPWSKLHVFDFNDNPLDCSCDLYNITRDLSSDITREEFGPYCMDPRTERYLQVFHMKGDICQYKSKHEMRKQYIEYHFSKVKVVLIILGVFASIAALLAVILGFLRYRRYQRSINYPYASQILYNPVSTTSSKY